MSVAEPFPRLQGRWEQMALQLARFAVVGAILSALSAGTYLIPAVVFGTPPLLANFFCYCVTACAGFLLHGRLSFAGHGSRDRPERRAGRFLVVSLLGLALNSLFVWVLTSHFDLSPWWPMLPMLFVTPLCTFYLHRRWVYR